MSLFSNLFSAAKSVQSSIIENTQSQEFTADFGEKTVKVRFSVADLTSVKLTDEITVEDVLISAAKLSNFDLTSDYTVLMNGRQVNIADKYINGATYKISVAAGTAG
jgi:hypothetical protein